MNKFDDITKWLARVTLVLLAAIAIVMMVLSFAPGCPVAIDIIGSLLVAIVAANVILFLGGAIASFVDCLIKKAGWK